MQGDWQQLGIEPTDDALAIKRAYALRLRTTRPDDDAGAYQRLREAYERALKVAGSRRIGSRQGSNTALKTAGPLPGADPKPSDNDADGASPHNDANEGVVGYSADDRARVRAGAAPHLDLDDEDWIWNVGRPESEPVWATTTSSIDALVRELTAHGEASSMIDAWPDIRRRVEALPLRDHRRAAIAFADMAIAEPLPVELLATISDTFGWTRDFRLGRALGAARLGTLLQLLERALPGSIDDPRLRQKYRNVLRLDALLAKKAYVRAALLAIAVGPLQRVVEDADRAIVERAARSPHSRIMRTFAFARRAHMVLLLSVVAALGALLGADHRAIGVGVSVVIAWWIGSRALIRLVIMARSSLVRHGRVPALRARLTTLRERTILPVICCAFLCASSVGFADVATAFSLRGVVEIMMLPILLVIAWPQDDWNAFFALTFALYVGIYAWASYSKVWIPVAFVSAFAWACLSAWVLDNGSWPIVARSQARLRRWRSAGPLQRRLLDIVLLVPSLPLACIRLSRVLGAGMVFAGFAIGIGLDGMGASTGLQRWTPLVIGAAVLILFGLHNAALRAVDALHDSASEP